MFMISALRHGSLVFIKQHVFNLTELSKENLYNHYTSGAPFLGGRIFGLNTSSRLAEVCILRTRQKAGSCRDFVELPLEVWRVAAFVKHLPRFLRSSVSESGTP